MSKKEFGFDFGFDLGSEPEEVILWDFVIEPFGLIWAKDDDPDLDDIDDAYGDDDWDDDDEF